MNKNMRNNNATKICPNCGIAYRDGHRHRSGYGNGKPRCPRQHIRRENKQGKKGKPIPYSRGGED